MQQLGRWIVIWQWALLLLLLPLFLFPSGFRGLVTLAIPIFWLIRKFIYGKFVTRSPYDLAVLALLAMIGVSTFVSFDITLSLPRAIGILFGIALFYAILDFSSYFSPWPVVGVYLVGGVLLTLISLVGVHWLPPFDFLNGIRLWLPAATSIEIPGTVGGIINQNELAGTLTWIAPLALACLLGLGKSLWIRGKLILFFVIIACFLTIFALIATSSRGGILALGVGSTIVIVFFIPTRWRVVLAVGLVTLVLIAIAFGMRSVNNDVMGDTLGLTGRVEIWSRAMIAIGDFPLTGMGINSFRQVVQTIYPLFAIPADIDLAHAHNHLLQVALDIGLPGLVAYVSIWIISTALLWEARSKLVRHGMTDDPNYSLIAGLAGALVAGWVFGIFDAVSLGSRPSFMWWMLIGLTGSVYYAVISPVTRYEPDSPAQTAERPTYDESTVPPPIIPTVTSRYSKS